MCRIWIAGRNVIVNGKGLLLVWSLGILVRHKQYNPAHGLCHGVFVPFHRICNGLFRYHVRFSSGVCLLNGFQAIRTGMIQTAMRSIAIYPGPKQNGI